MEKRVCHDWPKPPIWPEDLPLIRELLGDQAFEELLLTADTYISSSPSSLRARSITSGVISLMPRSMAYSL